MRAQLFLKHPAIGGPAGTHGLHLAIDSLQGVPKDCPASEYDELVTELDRAVRRLEAVKLRVAAAADADRITKKTGMADTLRP